MNNTLNSDTKFFYGINDAVFKSIIFDYDEGLTKWFLKHVLKPTRCNNFKNVIFNNVERPISSKDEKKKRLDILLTIDDKYICNIEVDTNSSPSTYIKNYAYRSALYSQIFRIGEKYSNDFYIIGIDIRLGLGNNYNREDIILVQNGEGKQYIQNFEMLVYNVDKIKEYWYTLDTAKMNYFAFILMLVLNEKELKEFVTYLSGENKTYVEMFIERITEMNKAPKFYIPWTWEHEIEMSKKIDRQDAYNRGTEYGIEQGIEKGLEEGIMQGNEIAEIDVATKMLLDGFSPEKIKKYVKLPLNKINEIKVNLL